ncbi:MAG: glycosyltransferase family 2 protein [Planctomycetes bacterium]|nr:glycosyltransferase family 2 protein [Planctomycetota bacterium]
MRASIVIPTLNGGPQYFEVLDRLAEQDYRPKPEIVVVDSGSTDGTLEASKKIATKVIQIDKRTFQHGRTRNLGISQSSGDVIALLTQDALPSDKQWLSKIVRNYADPRVGGVYTRQFPRPECDPVMKHQLLSWAACRASRVVQEPFGPGEWEQVAPIQRLQRCAFDNVCSSIRRKTWEQVPFPEVRFGEDVAWGKSALLAGWAIVYEPEAPVIHSHEFRMWYQFKRTYLDHGNLNQLFGIQTIPTQKFMWQCFWNRAKEYRQMLKTIPGLTARDRLRWTFVAVPYAFLENAAQYFGAKSNWKLQNGSPFYKWLDGKLRRGV